MEPLGAPSIDPHAIWAASDSEGSGVVRHEQIYDGICRVVTVDVSRSVVMSLLQETDVDGSGCVNKDRFLEFVAKVKELEVQIARKSQKTRCCTYVKIVYFLCACIFVWISVLKEVNTPDESKSKKAVQLARNVSFVMVGHAMILAVLCPILRIKLPLIVDRCQTWYHEWKTRPKRARRWYGRNHATEDARVAPAPPKPRKNDAQPPDRLSYRQDWLQRCHGLDVEPPSAPSAATAWSRAGTYPETEAPREENPQPRTFSTTAQPRPSEAPHTPQVPSAANPPATPPTAPWEMPAPSPPEEEPQFSRGRRTHVASEKPCSNPRDAGPTRQRREYNVEQYLEARRISQQLERQVNSLSMEVRKGSIGRGSTEATALQNVTAIGMAFLQLPPEPLIVKAVTRGSWADKVGFIAGDEIAAVNGIPVGKMTARAFAVYLRDRPVTFRLAKPEDGRIDVSRSDSFDPSRLPRPLSACSTRTPGSAARNNSTTRPSSAMSTAQQFTTRPCSAEVRPCSADEGRSANYARPSSAARTRPSSAPGGPRPPRPSKLGAEATAEAGQKPEPSVTRRRPSTAASSRPGRPSQVVSRPKSAGDGRQQSALGRSFTSQDRAHTCASHSPARVRPISSTRARSSSGSRRAPTLVARKQHERLC